jgi:hypothetical protein
MVEDCSIPKKGKFFKTFFAIGKQQRKDLQQVLKLVWRMHMKLQFPKISEINSIGPMRCLHQLKEKVHPQPSSSLS